MYKETENVVRTHNEESEKFVTSTIAVVAKYLLMYKPDREEFIGYFDSQIAF